MKFTVELREADSILQSRRLLGFAAIERMKKGLTHQALPLELIHLEASRRFSKMALVLLTDWDRGDASVHLWKGTLVRSSLHSPCGCGEG